MSARPSYRETYGYLPEPCVRLLESGPDGEELMLRVVARLGGQRVKIPARLTATSVIVQELGPADAERVWKIWRGGGASQGDMLVAVPRMTAAQNKARRAKVLSYDAAGVSVREIARRMAVTEQAVYGMLRKARSNGEMPTPQLDLFPA